MRVTYAENGGWGAQFKMRAPPAILDAKALPRAEREDLERLIQAAFSHPVQGDGKDRRASGSYAITVEDGGKLRSLSVAEAEEGNEPAAALREWIVARLR